MGFDASGAAPEQTLRRERVGFLVFLLVVTVAVLSFLYTVKPPMPGAVDSLLAGDSHGLRAFAPGQWRNNPNTNAVEACAHSAPCTKWAPVKEFIPKGRRYTGMVLVGANAEHLVLSWK